MNKEQVLLNLENYINELCDVLSRFTRDRDGIHINMDDGYRMKQITIELNDLIRDHIPNSVNHASMIVECYNEGVSNWSRFPSYASVNDIRGVVQSLKTRIERNPSLFENSKGEMNLNSDDKIKFEGINIIINRFHLVVRQLRERYNNREALDVNDEYDVQDLFHSLLNLYFNDIRPEEWTPSYAGGSSRVDFLLPEIDTVIEIKKTRKSLSTKELGEQLIVDIAKYKNHPQCNRLICFVYDSEGRISNPRGLESDLGNSDSDIDVQVIIVPKHL